MQRHHATKALEIYRRVGLQVVITHNINAFSDITDPIAIWLTFFLLGNFIKSCPGFQAERLSEFYDICKSLDLGRGERFIKIEQV